MSDDVGQDAKDFLMIVQSMALSAYARSEKGSKAIGIFMASATEAARRLPADRGSLACALEFAKAHLPEFRSDRLAPDYIVPAWISPKGSDAEWKPGAVEEQVDGKWGPENPRWIGLPGTISANLNILATLREKSAQTIDQLVGEGCGSASSIRARLSYMERQGLVCNIASKPPRWSLGDHPDIKSARQK